MFLGCFSLLFATLWLLNYFAQELSSTVLQVRSQRYALRSWAIHREYAPWNYDFKMLLDAHLSWSGPQRPTLR